VHPRRRGAAAAIAAGVALICFGAGIGVGIAIAPGGGAHHRHGPIIIRPYDMPKRGPGLGPRYRRSPLPSTSAAPTPSATS
jgi:hypothetical protein